MQLEPHSILSCRIITTNPFRTQSFGHENRNLLQSFLFLGLKAKNTYFGLSFRCLRSFTMHYLSLSPEEQMEGTDSYFYNNRSHLYLSEVCHPLQCCPPTALSSWEGLLGAWFLRSHCGRRYLQTIVHRNIHVIVSKIKLAFEKKNNAIVVSKQTLRIAKINHFLV